MVRGELFFSRHWKPYSQSLNLLSRLEIHFIYLRKTIKLYGEIRRNKKGMRIYFYHLRDLLEYQFLI